MRRITLVLVAILVSFPVAEVTAQTAQRASFTPVGWVQDFPQDTTDRPSITRRIATGIGGALLGAGLGFFASQVIQGDWQDTGSPDPINRTLWAAVGGSVGFTAGVRFPLGGRGTLGRPGLPRGRDHLGIDELQGLGINNAYEAVEALRPEWLIIRGNRSLAASVDPVRVEGSGAGVTSTGSTPFISETETIQVYVDGVNMGGVGSLSTVNVLIIKDLYFLDAARATARFGRSNPHGAILVIT